MKPYILDLDKPRELRFGFKANRLIRQKFGDKSIESLLDTIKWDEMPTLTWAVLKWDDKQLTVEQVETLLDEAIPAKYTILKVTEIVMGAIAEHMGADLKKGKAGGTKKAEEVKVEAVTEEKKKPTATIPSTKKRKK